MIRIVPMKKILLALTIATATALIASGCIHVTVIKTTPDEAKNLSTNAPALKKVEDK